LGCHKALIFNVINK